MPDDTAAGEIIFGIAVLSIAGRKYYPGDSQARNPLQ